MKRNEVPLHTSDVLYDFVLLRDASGDSGELIASLRVPEHPNHPYVISRKYPHGELNTHSALALDSEQLAAINTAFDQFAKSKKLRLD